MSVGQLADNGTKSMFDCQNVALFAKKDGFVIGSGICECESRLNVLFHIIKLEATRKTLFVLSYSSDLCHRRFVYIKPRAISPVHTYLNDVPKSSSPNPVCRACKLRMAHKLPSVGHFDVAQRDVDIVHSDIVGRRILFSRSISICINVQGQILSIHII